MAEESISMILVYCKVAELLIALFIGIILGVVIAPVADAQNLTNETNSTFSENITSEPPVMRISNISGFGEKFNDIKQNFSNLINNTSKLLFYGFTGLLFIFVWVLVPNVFVRGAIITAIIILLMSALRLF